MHSFLGQPSNVTTEILQIPAIVESTIINKYRFMNNEINSSTSIFKPCKKYDFGFHNDRMEFNVVDPVAYAF